MGSCSVIMVAKQGGALLFATIENVLQQGRLGELIVFDNGNSPAIVSRLQQRGLADPRIKVISGHDNVGYATACNIASRQATSPYLVILKAGHLLSPDALSKLISALEDGKKSMLSGVVVQGYDNSIKTIFRTQIVTPKSVFLDTMRIKSNRKRAYAQSARTEAQNNILTEEKPFEVVALSAACFCVRASDYKKLGGLDERFYPQSEELDFALRVKQVGGRVLCAHSVKVTALPHIDTKPRSVLQQVNETKNMVRYLNKFFAGHLVVGTLLLLNVFLFTRLMLKIIFGGVSNLFRLKYFKKNRSDFNTNFADIKAKRLMILALGAIDLTQSKELENKVVLVTGATSQVGLCVIRRLIASGAAVLAISRGDEIPYRHAHLKWLKGDLTDHAVSLHGYCVDAVVHCAPLWHLPPLLEMLKKYEAKRVIAFSSISVFTKLLSNNAFEKDLVLKLKAAEESVAEKCRELTISYSIFRPTQMYGVGLDMGITRMAKIIRRFGFMCVYPPAVGLRQPVHVDDLAVAVVKAMNNEATYGNAYNLSGGEMLTYREMLARIFALYKKKQRIIGSTMLPFLLDMCGKIARKKHINGEIARRMNDDLTFFHDDATRDFDFKPCKFLSGGIKDIERF